jgi:predicted amidohydrolase YtcJ
MKNVKITTEDNKIVSVKPSIQTALVVDGELQNYKNSEFRQGYTDSHCHVWGLGMMNSGLDIAGHNSAEETAKAAFLNNFKRGDFVVGRGWNNENWDDKSFPDKSILDEKFPKNPVILTRVDGHAVWCNSLALEIAGINEKTPNPEGGKILKNEKGIPKGILIDNAMELINCKIPEFTNLQLSEFIVEGLEICRENGITAVHDMDVSPRMIDIYKKLAKNDELSIFVHAFVSAQNNEVFDYKITPFSADFFTIKGIKLYADGALGSYGAALLEDYADKPGEKGILMLDSNQILEKCLLADDIGFDVAIHAIGDRAVREVLNAYEMFRANKPESKINLRIEHSQIVHPDDIPRFKELNVIASVQPIHFISDAEMALSRLGRERLLSSGYPWKSFLDNGVLMIAGSDFPIETYDVNEGIKAFTLRKTKLKKDPEFSKQKITMQQAIECYTVNPYLALGIQDRGKIEAGYKTDLVIYQNGKYQKSAIAY